MIDLHLRLWSGTELVSLSYTRGVKAWLWFAYVRVEGRLGSLQGRPGETAQQAIDNATQAAITRDADISVRAEPAIAVDLTNL